MFVVVTIIVTVIVIVTLIVVVAVIVGDDIGAVDTRRPVLGKRGAATGVSRADLLGWWTLMSRRRSSLDAHHRPY